MLGVHYITHMAYSDWALIEQGIITSAGAFVSPHPHASRATAPRGRFLRDFDATKDICSAIPCFHVDWNHNIASIGAVRECVVPR